MPSALQGAFLPSSLVDILVHSHLYLVLMCWVPSSGFWVFWVVTLSLAAIRILLSTTLVGIFVSLYVWQGLAQASLCLVWFPSDLHHSNSGPCCIKEEGRMGTLTPWESWDSWGRLSVRESGGLCYFPVLSGSFLLCPAPSWWLVFFWFIGINFISPLEFLEATEEDLYFRTGCALLRIP